MENKIQSILRILHDSRRNYWGFVLTSCKDGKQVFGQISGGSSNITAALCRDESIYSYYDQVNRKEITDLPYAGCEPEKIREFVKNNFETIRQ
jgi:hypothetical protein